MITQLSLYFLRSCMATVQSIECTSIFSIIHLLGPFNRIREENMEPEKETLEDIVPSKGFEKNQTEMVNKALVRWEVIILKRHPMNSI